MTVSGANVGGVVVSAKRLPAEALAESTSRRYPDYRGRCNRHRLRSGTNLFSSRKTFSSPRPSRPSVRAHSSSLRQVRSMVGAQRRIGVGVIVLETIIRLSQ
jgi:hypothetical protein